MRNSTKTAGVNPDQAASQELVEVTLDLPASVWERIKELSVTEMLTTDEVVATAIEHYSSDAEDDGTAPMFFSERTVRYVRECCAIVGVDADEWAEGWIALGHLEPGLNGEYDVTNGGIAVDLVEEYNDADGHPRTPEAKAALYEKFRAVACRYQQELKQEAAASMEGGEA